MKLDPARFTWQNGDLVFEEKPVDHRKMSEAEKAFFLKQQKDEKR